MGRCIHLHSFTCHNLVAPSHNEIRTPGVLCFSCTEMIFLTVNSFCCLVEILARLAQSGFVGTHAAILLYFELVRLIFGC